MAFFWEKVKAKFYERYCTDQLMFLTLTVKRDKLHGHFH